MGEKTKQSTKAPLFGGRELLFSQRELLLLVGPLLVEQLLEVTVGMADTMMAVSYTHLTLPTTSRV